MKADNGYQKDGSPLNRTDAALIGRGIDCALAAKLRANKWTLAKLKEATDPRLNSLGISAVAIAGIRAGPRSEIPFDSLAKVLIANRFVCRVCRDPEESVVVPHVEEWSVSIKLAISTSASLLSAPLGLARPNLGRCHT